MNKKILLFVMSFIILFSFAGCGNSEEVDDESPLNTIRDAINKVYENNETLTTANVQKYMVGNWTIVEAPANTTRSIIPSELDSTTKDIEWTTMFITACNSKTNLCKDLRIFRNEEEKLYVGSESAAVGQKQDQ